MRSCTVSRALVNYNLFEKNKSLLIIKKIIIKKKEKIKIKNNSAGQIPNSSVTQVYLEENSINFSLTWEFTLAAGISKYLEY